MKTSSATCRMLLLALTFMLAACNTLQSSAQQDPMKCERDAKCDKKRARSFDCSSQCVDDPACMERCEQIQQANGGLGH